MRNDALDIVNFFIRDLNNIELIIINNQDFIENRVCDVISICKHVITNKKISKEILNNSEYLFHGLGDIFRDKYQYKFILYNLINNKNFVNYFYELYDISSSIRIDNFIFTRDYELEDITYKKFIKENGKKYILYHSNDDNTDFIINKTSEKYINLNKKTNTFFDYIKILENSIELHLIDSSWAVFIYLLDAKYNLFKNKKIYLYAKRGYIKMFQDPILLNNWIFIKNLYSDTLLINIFTYSSNYISFYYKKLKDQMKYIM
jgi:hypothetical protein